ncbi:MAG: class I SAM-dependent methyltransferase [Bacteroidota bacterium]|nr:class I SAM-dependent methyltransferase [Bacteroidota bacterium]
MNIFNEYTDEYDLWFDKHHNTYQSEVLALKKLIPEGKKGIEIGVGTGRFSKPFSIAVGLEPSPNMAKIAEEKGITVVNGLAESLPFHNESFDFVLMVTTVCFLSDIPKAFSEAYRILQDQGKIILGIIDKNSPLGKEYEKMKMDNKFYSDAHFHSTEELTELLNNAGFIKLDYWQTLFNTSDNAIEDPKHGYGQGSFVAIQATKEIIEEVE